MKKVIVDNVEKRLKSLLKVMVQCQKSGLVLNRDHNATLEILREGLEQTHIEKLLLLDRTSCFEEAHIIYVWVVHSYESLTSITQSSKAVTCIVVVLQYATCIYSLLTHSRRRVAGRKHQKHTQNSVEAVI